MYIHIHVFVYIIYICIIVRVCNCPAINHTTKSVHVYYRNSRYRTMYAELKITEFQTTNHRQKFEILFFLNEHIYNTCIHMHIFFKQDVFCNENKFVYFIRIDKILKKRKEATENVTNGEKKERKK